MLNVPSTIIQDLAREEIHVDKMVSVAGGDINQACKLTTSSRNSYFLKYNVGSRGADIIQSEIHGLQILQDKTIPIPKQIHHKVDHDISYILMEWIEPQGALAQRVSQNLVYLHQVKHTSYGLDKNNHIGTLAQINTWNTDFVEFYMVCRLGPQIKLAHDSGMDLRIDVNVLHRVIGDAIPIESPCLIHGDLWSGNMICSPAQAYFIDPSVSYGHREMDLAMMNLFGGFRSNVFDMYDDMYPLEAQWRDRLDLFQLYYLLVHLNIFGVPYRTSVQRILDKYLA